MAERPFTVVWEACNADEYSNPDAEWKRYEQVFNQERDAVHQWVTAKRYANTRPVSITPEPDWERYTYDGRTPLKK